MNRARAAIILAAGQGTRMKSELPKVLHQVGGRAMLDWAIASVRGAGVSRIVVVVSKSAPALNAHVEKALGANSIAIQDPPLGTGHAVRAAEQALADFDGDAVVLYGDGPLIQASRVGELFDARASSGGMTVLGFSAANPFGYGRLIVGADSTLERIVEEKEASEAERAVKLSNSGVICADAQTLFKLLAQVKNDNAKGEYYLTDVPALGRTAGVATRVVMADESETLGVNSRAELAQAEAVFQQRARKAAMDAGVTLIDPASVYFSYDTEIAADVVIEPNVFFGPGVKIGQGARIKTSCRLEGAQVGAGAQLGPFAQLRPGAKLGANSHIGNFVEVKNSNIGEGAKANHLAYVGDADVGARANLGAGTITCNYDGFDKYRTTIGADAFIGSDTALVAPVTVGEGAYTGTGSVITKDVPSGALGVGRARQENIEGWADKNRARKQKKKDGTQ
ncbi:MAG: bifunctional UDP-N-acetylglucosamine diphosphorylase/glucosamine-1-phosphate N-acetyltransferase GlmU [Terricaulis sp.]